MATRKPRKFAEGDYIEDDAVQTEEQNASNNAIAAAAPAKTPSFKEAFAAARSGGDKTFEWGGKKFTTELAKPKAAAKAAPKAEVKTLAPADKGETRKALPLKSTKSEKNAFMGSTGLKKGGSVKGWGQARGARKAKVY
jgi:hypothetical protein